MPITRSTGAFIGTDESALQVVGAGATQSGNEVDVLGDNTSTGELEVYALVTATAVNSVDIRFNARRLTGQAYLTPNFTHPVSTINGTVRVNLGRISAARFMTADLRNNNGSASVSVFVGYTLTKVS